MLAFLTFSALLIASTWAHPRRPYGTGQEPRSMSSCAGLGEGATDTASYKFTLAALNTTLPNIEAPLVLGWSASEGDEEASDWAMSIQAEWDSERNDWPYLTLQSGSLLPQPGPLQQGLSAHSRSIAPGEEVSFGVRTAGAGRAGSAIYCTATRNGRTLLSLNNNMDGFSLCQPMEPHPYANRILVWSADAHHSTVYDSSTCYSVDVVIHSLY